MTLTLAFALVLTLTFVLVLTLALTVVLADPFSHGFKHKKCVVLLLGSVTRLFLTKGVDVAANEEVNEPKDLIDINGSGGEGCIVIGVMGGDAAARVMIIDV